MWRSEVRQLTERFPPGCFRFHGTPNLFQAAGRSVKGKSPSSSRWLQRHIKDPLVAQASREMYRSRAAYKIIEIDDKYNFLRPKAVVVDCGASPGSWSQVSAQRIGTTSLTREELEAGRHGVVLSVDIQIIRDLPGVIVLPPGDITHPSTQEMIMMYLRERRVDVVLSDMAPNACGISELDHQRIMRLGYGALSLANKVLQSNGVFVCKLWQGPRVNEFKSTLKNVFGRVLEIRPSATRKESSEIYMYAEGFKPDVVVV